MKKIQYNSPVILTFALLSALSLLLGQLSGGYTTEKLFSVYRSSFLDPFSFLRLLGHVLGHSNFSHFAGNILMILILGPMVEERYGSKHTLFLIGITAVVTGLIHCLFSPGTALMGASGVVFMLIFLASLSGMQKNRIPLTLILVVLIYFGQELYRGLFVPDNISQLTHIVGGCCGILCGLYFSRKNS